MLVLNALSHYFCSRQFGGTGLNFGWCGDADRRVGGGFLREVEEDGLGEVLEHLLPQRRGVREVLHLPSIVNQLDI